MSLHNPLWPYFLILSSFSICIYTSLSRVPLLVSSHAHKCLYSFPTPGFFFFPTLGHWHLVYQLLMLWHSMIYTYYKFLYIIIFSFIQVCFVACIMPFVHLSHFGEQVTKSKARTRYDTDMVTHNFLEI